MFEDISLSPMLIGKEASAFDNEDYIYEFKFDGVRCLAFLEPKAETQLINKRRVIVSNTYPELSLLHKQVKEKCVLDGEIVVLNNGRPDFSAVQKRSLMSNKTKIAFAAKLAPVSFIAFDILYLKDKRLTTVPLIKRKELLFKTVKAKACAV